MIKNGFSICNNIKPFPEYLLYDRYCITLLFIHSAVVLSHPGFSEPLLWAQCGFPREAEGVIPVMVFLM